MIPRTLIGLFSLEITNPPAPVSYTHLDVYKRQEETQDCGFSFRELFILAVATSIDALAVGVTFSFLSVNLLEAVTVIGSVTFAISLAGVAIGSRFGDKLKEKAEIMGGLILIILGCKILIQHLFF